LYSIDIDNFEGFLKQQKKKTPKMQANFLNSKS